MPNDFNQVFEFYIEDDRYSVPTLRLVAAENLPRAWEMASLLLNESAHHVGVELRIADRRVGGLGTCVAPSADIPVEAPKRASE